MKEPRITLARERLFISGEKIRVDYEFRNNSSRVVTSEILFPASYHTLEPGPDDGDSPLVGSHFRVWCNGKRLKVRLQPQALLGHGDGEAYWDDSSQKVKDVSALLEPLGLLRSDYGAANIRSLKPKDLVKLWKAGVIPILPQEQRPRQDAPEREWLRVAETALDLDASQAGSPEELVAFWKTHPESFNMPIEPFPGQNAPEEEWVSMAEWSLRRGTFKPNWDIYEAYRWRQVFPAKGTVRLRIEYVPIPMREDSFRNVNDPDTYRLSHMRDPEAKPDLPNLEGTGRTLCQEAVVLARRLGRPVHRTDCEPETGVLNPFPIRPNAL